MASSLVVVAVVSCMASCASPLLTPYPDDWPSQLTDGNCTSISGAFRNEAIATTLWRSPTVPATSRAFLSSLLNDGTSGSVSEVHAAIGAVSIHGDKLTYDLGDSTGKSASPEGKWECDPRGFIVVRFRSKMVSEESEGHADLVLSLSMASDRSLVVRDEIRTRSVSFGFIPNGSHAVYWSRYRPANAR